MLVTFSFSTLLVLIQGDTPRLEEQTKQYILVLDEMDKQNMIRLFEFDIQEQYARLSTSLPSHTVIYRKWPLADL